MSVSESITIDEFIARMDALAKIDPKAMGDLIGHRVKCNTELGEHESVQVGKENEDYVVGILGILNGVFGAYHSGERKGWGAIAALVDEDDPMKGECTGFSRIENDVSESDVEQETT